MEEQKTFNIKVQVKSAVDWDLKVEADTLEEALEYAESSIHEDPDVAGHLYHNLEVVSVVHMTDVGPVEVVG